MRLLVDLVWATLLAALVAAPALAAPTVRVLVYEGAGPVSVAAIEGDAARRTVLTGRGGLRANGRRAAAPVRVAGPAGVRVGDRRYRGSLEAHACPAGVCVVNRVPLEAYVAGTILGEVYGGWAPDALRAQAVVIRTYALHHVRRAPADARFDLRGGTDGQVYLGAGGEGPTAGRAARETRGEHLTYGGVPILAAYHAASGGRTASAAEIWGQAVPYLVSVPVAGEEESPDAYWRASLSRTILGRTVTALGKPVGSVEAVEVAGRGQSGRARTVRVRGTAGVALVEARALRRAVGLDTLRSTFFDVRSSADAFVFVGSGRGHGVGMSQWGAKSMADRGAGYREILRWFYPGTELERLDDGVAAATGAR